MEKGANAINWFEIPVTDYERAKAFYSAIFDYEMPEWEMGPVKMGILPYDQSGGGVGGAISTEEGSSPSTDGTRVYLNGGQDLSVVLDRVPGANGTVILPKTKITDEIGYMAIFQDTEGNHLGLHSPG